MIETLKNTKLYKSLNLEKFTHNAYLFYSLDVELNNNIALLFAKQIMCELNNGCNECSSCKQFNANSHPDFFKIDQSSIKVDDINQLIAKLNTKPISNSKKVFVILNAENINEIAQNKMLKSLEECNESNIFILTTSKIDKLLPTILSRLHKINLPKVNSEDLNTILDELKQSNVDIKNYLNSNLTLTEIFNLETNENYRKTLYAIKYIFENLKTSQDIPQISSSIPEYDKTLFLPILQKLFLSVVNNSQIFDDNITNLIKFNYPQQAIINSLTLIENAYKKQMANVNLTYIIDNLLFNILKEKFLCKQ